MKDHAPRYFFRPLALLSVLLILTSSRADDSAIFRNLPKPPNYTSQYGPYFYTRCVSQNGLFIGGYVCDNEYGTNGVPFIYHVGDDALIMPPLLANCNMGAVVWVSDDGNTAYGGCSNMGVNGTGVVWQNGVPTDLGPNGFSPRSANGVYGERPATYSDGTTPHQVFEVYDSSGNSLGYIGPIDNVWGGGGRIS